MRRALAARIASGELRGPAAKQAIADANVPERAGGRRPAQVLLKMVETLGREVERHRAQGALKAPARKQLRDYERARVRRRLEALRKVIDRILSRLD